MSKSDSLTLYVQDISGQREFVAKNVPVDASWGETMSTIVGNMSLPKNAPTGEEIVWTGRLNREGRHLHGSEINGETFQEGDRVVLQPEVNAG